MKMFKDVAFVLINLFLVSYGLQCNLPSDNYRLDCFPAKNADQHGCEVRGCCWVPLNNQNNIGDSSAIPSCYYPSDYPKYQTKSWTPTNRGFKAVLSKQQKSFLPNEILNLNFEVIYETNSRIRIRITDPNNARYEVPLKLGAPDLTPPNDPEYEFIMSTNGSFSFEVKRRSDGFSLFKSFGPLLYSDQFMQISTFMATNQVYGMGQQSRPFLHNIAQQWTRIGLWTRDHQIDLNNNLYGVHPFYMGMPDNGKAYGVYFFNSNAQEFVLQPAPAISYRTIGGILDFFIFTGATPEKTVAQYTELIGRPMLPPFWSLGFHLSKYGYKDISHVKNVLLRNLDANIPIEVQWSDIDYMDGFRDFTYDPVNYAGMGNFVKEVRQKYGIRYVVIIDPAIAITKPGTYKPYDDGLEMNVYIRDSRTNQPLIGKVWPDNAVFPDFTNPNITKYWTTQIKRFHNSVPINGLWIDVNEPTNFYDGSLTGCSKDSPYDNPFFIPAIRDASLIKRTICPSALHYNNEKHYNLHSLYAYTEAVATNQALLSIIPNKRPFILSRSTFSGSGKYTFVWTGDNNSSWDQLAHSIRQILNFNMFGIPMAGADICGFLGVSNEELCIRWMQVGSFYPFMRNHAVGDVDQDPAAWSAKAQEIMKSIILVRYSLLPNLYTLFVKSHLYGGTVMRPLSFEFFSDSMTHSIDKQFMIGRSILISPVLDQGATSVLAYFPAGVWYNLHNLDIVYSGDTGRWMNLDTPLNSINDALRGGHILTILPPSMTTDLSRKNNFTLLCALSRDHTAIGDLYWDDGESLDSYTGKKYSYHLFTANSSYLLINPVYVGYTPIPALHSFAILGLNQTSIEIVRLNGNSIPFSFDAKRGILRATTGNADMTKPINIEW